MENVLSIQSFGARLRVKDGLFIVHIPDITGGGQHREEAFAANSVESILLHQHTSVSANALLLAQQHQIPVLVLDEHDFPSSYMAGLRPSSSIQIWKRQLLLHGTSEGLGFARDWLCLKVRRKIEWLSKLRSYREGKALDTINSCIGTLQDSLARLANHTLTPVDTAASSLRGIEGYGQRAYLDTLSNLLPAQTKFEGRSRQPANDLFNALLNYAYGILYRWVEKALWETGLNPYIGFLHTDERYHKSLLFDFIEPFRPWMDKVAFKLCVRKEANVQQHATTLPDGGLWLNAAGKRLVAEAAQSRFNRKMIQVGDRLWRMRQAISVEARRFAIALRDTVEPWPKEQVIIVN